jgi:hypothetical protein
MSIRRWNILWTVRGYPRSCRQIQGQEIKAVYISFPQRRFKPRNLESLCYRTWCLGYMIDNRGVGVRFDAGATDATMSGLGLTQLNLHFNRYEKPITGK